MKEYQKHEFCREVGCEQLKENTVYPGNFYCKRRQEGCTKTAKQFHKWLENNGYTISKD